MSLDLQPSNLTTLLGHQEEEDYRTRCSSEWIRLKEEDLRSMEEEEEVPLQERVKLEGMRNLYGRWEECSQRSWGSGGGLDVEMS